MKKTAKIIFNIGYTVVVIGVLAIALLFVGTKVDVLGYEVKIVKSGSMEPAIMTGGIVIVKSEPIYSVGDIVTFGKDTRTQIPVTHRIVEKTGEGASAAYVTKGDANEEKDPIALTTGNILGKVAFTIPYIGYVIEFARSPLGFALLIGIPAAVIVLDEFANIVWEMRLYRARKKREEALTRKNRLLAREDGNDTMLERHFQKNEKQNRKYI